MGSIPALLLAFVFSASRGGTRDEILFRAAWIFGAAMVLLLAVISALYLLLTPALPHQSTKRRWQKVVGGTILFVLVVLTAFVLLTPRS